MRSFEFCFDGIQKKSIVAIGMIGCKRNKQDFLKGYNQMLNKIEPEAIICFGNSFDEMEGNIIKVDYINSRKVVHYMGGRGTFAAGNPVPYTYETEQIQVSQLMGSTKE